jgi:outer membrane murein-binding lipoprotein Lpp
MLMVWMVAAGVLGAICGAGIVLGGMDSRQQIQQIPDAAQIEQINEKLVQLAQSLEKQSSQTPALQHPIWPSSSEPSALSTEQEKVLAGILANILKRLESVESGQKQLRSSLGMAQRQIQDLQWTMETSDRLQPFGEDTAPMGMFFDPLSSR